MDCHVHRAQATLHPGDAAPLLIHLRPVGVGLHECRIEGPIVDFLNDRAETALIAQQPIVNGQVVHVRPSSCVSVPTLAVERRTLPEANHAASFLEARAEGG